MKPIILSRRDLIKGGIKIGTGCFALGLSRPTLAAKKLFQPSVYIKIQQDIPVTLLIHRSEMGQHVLTSMVMLIAEELEVDPTSIKIEQATGDEKFGDQNTDGSTSARKNWFPLRKAGATARKMLISAGAKHFKTEESMLIAKNGHVVNLKTNERMSYQDLAGIAASLTPPKEESIQLKKDLSVIGTPLENLVAKDMVTGKATYGIDTHRPNMVFATIERSPTIDGKIKSLNAEEAKKVPGVLAVFPMASEGPSINTNEGIAVVAETYHAAIKARSLLKVEFENDGNLETSVKQNETNKRKVMEDGSEEDEIGDFEAAKESGTKVITATYETPYLVHAPMEPLACTAELVGKGILIHAPSQDPQRAREAIADATGFDEDHVTIKVTLLGGGFGRKSQPDFPVEAALIAKEIKKPVKLIWTREDEIRHGMYHATSVQYMEGVIDKENNITGFRHRSGFPSIAKLFTSLYIFGPTSMELGMGHTNNPYRFPNKLLEKTKLNSDLRIGWYRAVCNIFHAFAVESFLDELASTTRKDPVALRLSLLDNKAPKDIGSHDFNPIRLRSVIETCRDKSAWLKKRKAGAAIGFACHYSFMSYIAVAIEVEKKADKYRASKVTIVADCGINVNSDTVLSQLEGGVIFGLCHSYYGKISLKNGEVIQSNFHDYPMLRMRETPDIEVHIMPSTENPTGIGEPGVPPITPALTNAIFQASGQRIRSFPIG